MKEFEPLLKPLNEGDSCLTSKSKKS